MTSIVLLRVPQRSVNWPVSRRLFARSDVVFPAFRFVVSVFLSVSLALVVARYSLANCRCDVLGNQIGDEGAKAIALALEKNSALTNLVLTSTTTIVRESDELTLIVLRRVRQRSVLAMRVSRRSFSPF